MMGNGNTDDGEVEDIPLDEPSSLGSASSRVTRPEIPRLALPQLEETNQSVGLVEKKQRAKIFGRFASSSPSKSTAAGTTPDSSPCDDDLSDIEAQKKAVHSSSTDAGKPSDMKAAKRNSAVSEMSTISLSASEFAKDPEYRASRARETLEKEESFRIRSDMNDEAKWIVQAKILSLISIICSAILGTVAVVLGVQYDGVSLTSIGIEFYIDLVSSILVIWRFKTPKARQFENTHQEAEKKIFRDALRERNSTLLIGVAFLVLSIWIAVQVGLKATATSAASDEDFLDIATTRITLTSVIVFSVLTVLKFVLASKLKSHILREDAVCSLVGTLLSLVVCIGAFVELNETSDGAKKLHLGDIIPAVTLAFFMFCEGCFDIYKTTWKWTSQPQPLM